MEPLRDGGELRRWRTIDMLRFVAIFFFVLGALLVLWHVRSLVIATFLGFLFGIPLKRGVDRLERRGVRRGFGAAILVTLFLALLIGVGWALVPALRDQTRQLQTELPRAVDQIEEFMTGSTEAIENAIGTVGDGTTGEPVSLRNQLQTHLASALDLFFPVVSTTVGFFTGLLMIIFIAIYFSIDPTLYHRGLMHLLPKRSRERTQQTLENIEESLLSWFVARLMAMVAIGTIVTAVLYLLGVEAALALGVLTFFLEFIPFFGPILAAIPAIGIAFLDSPQTALWVLIAFIVIEQLEGNVITPLILQNRVMVPPLLTIIAVPLFGVLFGIAGALVAEPFLVVIMVTTQIVWVRRAIGDDVAIGAANQNGKA